MLMMLSNDGLRSRREMKRRRRSRALHRCWSMPRAQRVRPLRTVSCQRSRFARAAPREAGRCARCHAMAANTSVWRRHTDVGEPRTEFLVLRAPAGEVFVETVHAEQVGAPEPLVAGLDGDRTRWRPARATCRRAARAACRRDDAGRRRVPTATGVRPVCSTRRVAAASSGIRTPWVQNPGAPHERGPRRTAGAAPCRRRPARRTRIQCRRSPGCARDRRGTPRAPVARASPGTALRATKRLDHAGDDRARTVVRDDQLVRRARLASTRSRARVRARRDART